jgi:hypothetical protein
MLPRPEMRASDLDFIVSTNRNAIAPQWLNATPRKTV